MSCIKNGLEKVTGLWQFQVLSNHGCHNQNNNIKKYKYCIYLGQTIWAKDNQTNIVLFSVCKLFKRLSMNLISISSNIFEVKSSSQLLEQTVTGMT